MDESSESWKDKQRMFMYTKYINKDRQTGKLIPENISVLKSINGTGQGSKHNLKMHTVFTKL